MVLIIQTEDTSGAFLCVAECDDVLITDFGCEVTDAWFETDNENDARPAPAAMTVFLGLVDQ